ncbi:MAG: 3-isopropylmalate dehydratase small subunit [Nitrososphaerota archaeon]|nr:3-isopropylmalate dehydratase small subunit [Candidatus Bathyarchaeota archaeon]MDW8048658.1 3-isopropylmalate dehydratase small subunit [Nitrososphaerota archaeon]
MRIQGLAIVYGDNVNTDLIIPSKYLTTLDPMELASHAMEGLDRDFAKKAEKGVILVAGRNFGCGSSREQAPIALKYAGVRCVIADSFARIFYRNAINIGLPVLECQGISGHIDDGDILEVYLEDGRIINRSKNETFTAIPLPDFILQILSDGGLIEHLKKRMGGKG